MDDKVWGILTCIDLHKCNGDKIRNKKEIKRFVRELCELIDMKRFGSTQVVHFGEDDKIAGFSMTQLIETSLISAHFANLSNNVYIDVFSCKSYNSQIVIEFCEKFFEAEKSVHTIVYRK